ncbi:hypothetical protein B0T10DRAFT_464615 [Thelonectria olida]|uniref:Uncharacterized protein n=1 Tax=Thelonectria olida TaxID=1576542 RepID=A0A9P8VTX2_9HYPO|nr:hypothetical protein B0T10DRAFT_464615 [Thelonectria olida]
MACIEPGLNFLDEENRRRVVDLVRGFGGRAAPTSAPGVTLADGGIEGHAGQLYQPPGETGLEDATDFETPIEAHRLRDNRHRDPSSSAAATAAFPSTQLSRFSGRQMHNDMLLASSQNLGSESSLPPTAMANCSFANASMQGQPASVGSSSQLPVPHPDDQFGCIPTDVANYFFSNAGMQGQVLVPLPDSQFDGIPTDSPGWPTQDPGPSNQFSGSSQANLTTLETQVFGSEENNLLQANSGQLQMPFDDTRGFEFPQGHNLQMPTHESQSWPPPYSVQPNSQGQNPSGSTYN